MLAQVPDLNDFVAGMQLLLKPEGVVTLEFPHLQRLIEENQFDTIYHEHFSYFSLRDHRAIWPSATASKLFDVEELPTHGGSLRVYLAHAGAARMPSPRGRRAARSARARSGFDELATYARFAEQVRAHQARAARRS